MNDHAIPAIVFRLEKFMPMTDIHTLLDNIRTRCSSWTGTGEYKAVLSFLINPPHDDRFMSDFGATVPYDPDGMDQILLDIPELNSVRRFHELDLNRGRKKKASGMKAPKPKPAIDSENLWRGWDKTKVAAGLRHMCTPEGLDEADRFAELLKGYPFSDKTPRENQTFIEMEVIAIMEDQFPHINEVDCYLNGAVVKELRVIADPDNQPKLGESVTWFRCQFGNHPSTFVSLCKSASEHLAAEKKKAAPEAAKLKPTRKPQGIAYRCNESVLETGLDYIGTQAV